MFGPAGLSGEQIEGGKMSKENGGPAFPKAALDPWGKTTVFNTGMSLRDYFAAKALPAVVSDVDFTSWAQCAEAAYDIADAMLAERVKL